MIDNQWWTYTPSPEEEEPIEPSPPVETFILSCGMVVTIDKAYWEAVIKVEKKPWKAI